MSALKPDEVARYLQENPVFFEEHAELLAEIHVPHPHGGKAIPLSERQVVSLRDKARALEGKLAELIQFGEENDVISEKVHRLAVALLSARTLSTVLHELYYNLREDFASRTRACGCGAGWAICPSSAPRATSCATFAAGLDAPFCGPNANFEAAGWFGEAAPHIRSVAFIPLRELDETFGLLALASEDGAALLPRDGHALPQADRRDGERGAAAVRLTRPCMSDQASAKTRAPHPRHLVAAYLEHLTVERRLSGDDARCLRARSRRAARGHAAASRPPHWHRTTSAARSAQLTAAGSPAARIARMLSAWRGFFRWLARDHGLATNPCAGLRAPKSPRALPKALAPDEARQLLDRRGRGRARGARPGDVRALLFVGPAAGRAGRARCARRRAIVRDAEVTVTGKGAKTRIVPVGAKARSAVARLARRPGGSSRAPASRRCSSARAASASNPRVVRQRLGRWALARRAWASTSIRTCCATRSPRTCCSRAATCARCRRCWATRASRPRRSTRTSTSSTSRRCTTPRIRGRRRTEAEAMSEHAPARRAGSRYRRARR